MMTNCQTRRQKLKRLKALTSTMYLWTASLLHSLHEGPDWWQETKTIPLIYKIQYHRWVTQSEAHFAGAHDLHTHTVSYTKHVITRLTRASGAARGNAALWSGLESPRSKNTASKTTTFKTCIKHCDCGSMWRCSNERDEVRKSAGNRHIVKTYNRCMWRIDNVTKLVLFASRWKY